MSTAYIEISPESEQAQVEADKAVPTEWIGAFIQNYATRDIVVNGEQGQIAEYLLRGQGIRVAKTEKGTPFFCLPRDVADADDNVVLAHPMDGEGEYKMSRVVASLALTMLSINWTMHQFHNVMSERVLDALDASYFAIRDEVYTIAESDGCLDAAYSWLD